MSLKRQPILIAMRGLPGSGKTTAALKWVAEDPDNRARIGRDPLRDALYGTRTNLTSVQEGQITRVQREAVRTLLRSGRDVVVDDTNLRTRNARVWADLAEEEGVRFEMMDVNTPLAECIARDQGRALRGGRSVGEQVIRDLDRRFKKRPKITPSNKPVPVPYTGTAGKPPAWIFDIDGTLAINNTGRSFYDMTRVGEDDPNPAVVALAKTLHAQGLTILVVSGRTDDGEEITADWLTRHLGDAWSELFMREEGDQRPDSLVKWEIFDNHIRDHFDVIGVVDDRKSVVAFWRSMGLTCFQVAEGDY